MLVLSNRTSFLHPPTPAVNAYSLLLLLFGPKVLRLSATVRPSRRGEYENSEQYDCHGFFPLRSHVTIREATSETRFQSIREASIHPNCPFLLMTRLGRAITRYKVLTSSVAFSSIRLASISFQSCFFPFRQRHARPGARYAGFACGDFDSSLFFPGL